MISKTAAIVLVVMCVIAAVLGVSTLDTSNTGDNANTTGVSFEVTVGEVSKTVATGNSASRSSDCPGFVDILDRANYVISEDRPTMVTMTFQITNLGSNTFACYLDYTQWVISWIGSGDLYIDGDNIGQMLGPMNSHSVPLGSTEKNKIAWTETVTLALKGEATGYIQVRLMGGTTSSRSGGPTIWLFAQDEANIRGSAGTIDVKTPSPMEGRDAVTISTTTKWATSDTTDAGWSLIIKDPDGATVETFTEFSDNSAKDIVWDVPLKAYKSSWDNEYTATLINGLTGRTWSDTFTVVEAPNPPMAPEISKVPGGDIPPYHVFDTVSLDLAPNVADDATISKYNVKLYLDDVVLTDWNPKVVTSSNTTVDLSFDNIGTYKLSVTAINSQNIESDPTNITYVVTKSITNTTDDDETEKDEVPESSVPVESILLISGGVASFSGIALLLMGVLPGTRRFGLVCLILGAIILIIWIFVQFNLITGT